MMTLLQKMRSDEDRPTIMVLQSTQNRLLVNDIAALRELPILSIRTEASDSNLPPLFRIDTPPAAPVIDFFN